MPKQVRKGRERGKIIIIVPFRSVPFLPDGKQKIPKKEQKNSKSLIIPLWPHFKPKQVGKDEREKIKIVVPFHSVPFLPDA